MGKNIIICCDGTGNEYGKNNTNVVGAYEAFVRDQEQVAFYDPGVGTFSVLLGRTIGKKVGYLLGLGFGWGLQKNIGDAYAYLMDHYEPDNDDRIYLFGFSRGAYTARSLAGMLFKCGLLQKGSHNLLPYVSKIYNTPDNDAIAYGFKKTYCHGCTPYFIGVWDTVGSLGHFYGKRFFDAKLRGNIKFAYHAISIDEKRKKFPVNRWDETKERPPEQTIEQVWFPGVHSDVGGWYPEKGLSDSALKWMLLKAKAAGIHLHDGWDSKKRIDPNPTHEKSQHESREGFYRLWWKVQRKIPENSLIHHSVFDRMNAGIGYNPSNLPKAYSTVQEDGEIAASEKPNGA